MILADEPTGALDRKTADEIKAPFLAVFDAEIFFLSLVLPFPLFIQWAHRQQDRCVPQYHAPVGEVDSVRFQTAISRGS